MNWYKQAMSDESEMWAAELMKNVKPHDHKNPHSSNKVADALADALSYTDNMGEENDPPENMAVLDNDVMIFLNFAFENLKQQGKPLAVALIGVIEKAIAELRQVSAEFGEWLSQNDTEDWDQEILDARFQHVNSTTNEKVRELILTIKKGLTALLQIKEINP